MCLGLGFFLGGFYLSIYPYIHPSIHLLYLSNIFIKKIIIIIYIYNNKNSGFNFLDKYFVSEKT